ncbi:Cytochrome c biogenesis protein CcmA [Nitratireductor basaltis]|uniref:Cytochrome c biogenesis protein CcmA n=1 Tax=Nitratireductor basaltis TaxID=472175 RepID=A0A084U6M1_9HYPH|nr:Cytochrome c biogenesis protein CcmA [Nitratireductor basaltis]
MESALSAASTALKLEVEELAGDRGDERVFSAVAFTLTEGEALLVTGPNGSGKSTLLRVLAGLLPKAQGVIRLGGGGEEWPDLAAACHYLGHRNGLKDAASVEENLRFWQSYCGHEHLEPWEALEMVGLGDIGHLPFAYLSTGQRRRVAIARMLVSYRPVWLLDEPTAGLDRASERQFSELMKAHLEDGGMIVAATHLPLGLDGVRELRMGGA